MDLRTPLALLLSLLLAGCQGGFVSSNGSPLRPFQDNPASAPAIAPANPAQGQPASSPDASAPATAQ